MNLILRALQLEKAKCTELQAELKASQEAQGKMAEDLQAENFAAQLAEHRTDSAKEQAQIFKSMLDKFSGKDN
mgnify:CR=1 FL=1